jgi:hypothetical protein
VDVAALFFIVIIAVVIRALIASANAGRRPRPTERRRQLRQLTPPMPPTVPLPASAAPAPPQSDPVVAVDADAGPDPDTDPDRESAYPTEEATSADNAPDETADLAFDVVEAATPPARRRYELSSSLDTTLSTSLTSSVIGEPGSVAAGPQTVALPSDLSRQVIELMGQGHEVAAVRLVCDEMDVGILDAQKTVRSLAGLPTQL